jgi:hypothetical protein
VSATRRARRYYSTWDTQETPVDTGHQRADAALNGNHRDLIKGVSAHTWPPESIDEWRRLAEAADRRLADGGRLTDTDTRALDAMKHVTKVEQAERKPYRTLWLEERARQTKTTTKERTAR